MLPDWIDLRLSTCAVCDHEEDLGRCQFCAVDEARRTYWGEPTVHIPEVRIGRRSPLRMTDRLDPARSHRRANTRYYAKQRAQRSQPNTTADQLPRTSR